MNRASQFLAAYRETGNISRAAEAAGISRDMHHRRMRKDPAYVAEFEMAKLEAIDLLEDEARTRAIEGRARDVYYQGVVCGTEMVYSDGLLQFLLRGAKPQVYRERHEITGKDGGPIDSTLTITFVTPPPAATE